MDSRHVACAKFSACGYLIQQTMLIMSRLTAPCTLMWQSQSPRLRSMMLQTSHCAQRTRCCAKLEQYGMLPARHRRPGFRKLMVSKGFPFYQTSSLYPFPSRFRTTLCIRFGRTSFQIWFCFGPGGLKVSTKVSGNINFCWMFGNLLLQQLQLQAQLYHPCLVLGHRTLLLKDLHTPQRHGQSGRFT